MRLRLAVVVVTVARAVTRHVLRRHPTRLPRRAAERDRVRRRSVRAVRALVRAGRATLEADPTAMALATATRDGRPSVADRAAEGRGRPRLRLLHQLRQPQGARARRRPAAPPAVLLAVARAPGAHRRAGGAGRARRSPTPTSRRGRSRAAGASTPRRRARSSRAATALESRYDVARETYGDAMPRPSWWGGYRVIPDGVRVLAGAAEPPARSAALPAQCGWVAEGSAGAVKASGLSVRTDVPAWCAADSCPRDTPLRRDRAREQNERANGTG